MEPGENPPHMLTWKPTDFFSHIMCCVDLQTCHALYNPIDSEFHRFVGVHEENMTGERANCLCLLLIDKVKTK
jgi:hypothetical protein